MNIHYLYANIWHPPYEDAPLPETPPAGEGAPAPETPPPATPETPPTPPTPPTTKFTQDQVNKMLADDRRKHQDQTKKAIAEAEALRSKAKLTQEERNDLDSRLQQLKDELLSKEELATKERDRLRKTHEVQLNQLTADRDEWKTKFTNASIRRAITDASVSADAYNPRQIVGLLRPDTRLVEVLDDAGQPTGDSLPKVRFNDIDKEGNPVTLELGVDDAIKRMREMDDYLNLFKGEGFGGLGNTNQPGGKKLDAKELAKDPAAYRKARLDGRLKFGD